MRLRPKVLWTAGGFLVLFTFHVFGQAQASADTKQKEMLRDLDLKAAEAILKRDEKAIARFFTVDSIVNNPRNGLTHGSAGVIEAARTGVIDYKSFERNVESIQLLGNTAILMGSEIVVSNNGDKVLRRYTNIWMKRGREWKIVARHANIICP